MFTRAVFILAIIAIADCNIQFKKSQLITRYESDRKEGRSTPISCPSPGCTVYSSIGASDVSINDGNTVVTTLDKIYKKEDGFLVGYHLPSGGNYTLEDRSALDSRDFIIFIAADSAGSGSVTTIEDSIIQPKGRRIVTVLIPSSLGAVLSAFKGTTAPKVYAADFDSVGTCRPVFTPGSVDSASHANVVVYSLATIDFGSTDASNACSVQKISLSPFTFTVPSEGQSYNLMSPLYTGCDGVFSTTTYYWAITINMQAGTDITQAVVHINDVDSISHLQVCEKWQAESKQQQNCFDFTGTQPQAYTFTESMLQVGMWWTKTKSDDSKYHYVALIEFGNGDWQIFGMFPLLVALCAAFLST